MLKLQAPAKINLFLRILGRRLDGYHELETIFERIDLADELTFAPQASGLTLTCSDPTLSCGPDNLVLKAARLLQQTKGTIHGAALHLDKSIPIAAGLGGGSSDAATTLLGLNRVWKLGFSISQLIELGAQLGSDVPFFLWEAPFAIGRGRGEQCEPLTATPPTLWHVLIVPPARLSTKDVYEGLAESRRGRPQESNLTAAAPSVTIALHALRNGSPRELAKGLINDLAPEAIRRCPVINEIHIRLRTAGCIGTLLSGSGSAVFGLCHDAAHARTIAQQLRASVPSDWFVRVVETWHESVLS